MDYETIKKYYDTKKWTKQMVRNAVRKGVITQEECDAILEGAEIASDAETILAILEGEI